MKTTAKPMTKWLLSLVFALVVISLLLVPQVLQVESEAAIDWSASTIHINNAEDLLTFIGKADSEKNFSGQTIYLDCDIDVNPGWSAEVGVSDGTLTLPSAPSNSWTNVGTKVTTNPYRDPRYEFAGTFDGQGYKISGIYSYRSTNDELNHFGLLFNKVNGGTVRNLVITNSLIYFTTTANNSESAYGGLTGGLKGGGTIENVYSEVTTVLAAASGKKPSIAWGGIAGWIGGSGTKMQNCVFAGDILTANSYGGTTGPATGVTWVIGGVAGEQEDGSTANLLGMPKNVLVGVPSVGIQVANQKNANNTTGGYNDVIAGHYGSDYGTRDAATVLAGAQSSSITGWFNFTGTHYDSYIPKIPIRVQTAADLLRVVKLVNDGTTTFSGMYIMVDNDIDVNPGWDASVTLSGSTGTGLANSTGTITLPPSPGTSWPNTGLPNVGTNGGTGYVNQFKGTFDGLGHVISGIYAYKQADQSRSYGLLFSELRNAVVRNLIITNSTLVWNQNAGYQGAGFGGLTGACRTDSSISNVYIEMDIVLQSNAHAKLAWGGIAGWNSATMTNCVFKGRMIETTAQNDYTYPATVTTRHIGGITGECEGGAITDCVGMVTFAVKESSVGFQATDQNTTNGGAHQAIAGHYNSDYGSTTRVYGGAQSSAPVSGWLNYTKACGTYVPATFMGSYLRPTLNDAAIGSFTAGTSYFPGSSVLISSTSDLNSMVSKVNADDYYGKGVVFKITTDLIFNSNDNMYARSTFASGAAITMPDSHVNFTRFTNFSGVLDGQGHKISGLYAKRTAYNRSKEGGLFYDFSGTIKNLAITDTFFCGDHSGYGEAAGVQYGGLAGSGSGTIENCYFDYDCFMINNYACNEGANAESVKFCGYGYLFGGLSGTLNLKNVQCAGRFWVCNASIENTIQTTGGSACGVIAGSGNSKTVNIENFVFSGPRSTYIGGSGGTNDVAYLVHWGNTNCNFSGNNFYGKSNGSAGNTTGVGPTADGTNFKFIPRFGEVGPAELATTFGSGTFSLPMWAQKGSTSGKFRLLAKISRSAAKSATEVGFYLTNSENKHATVPVTGVYKSVTASGATRSAGSLTGRGDYLIAIAVTGATKGQSLTIQPYIKIGSTYYYGASTDWTIE